MALPFPPTALASAPSGVFFASGSTLHLVPTAGPSTSACPPEATTEKAQSTGLIRKVALNEDATLAVTAGDDKSLRVWDVKDGALTLRSTRNTAKRVACLSFSPEGILVTDKVGDVYLYPIDPRPTGERPQGFKAQADPSLNPDADFLLGHVSVVSQHILVPGGKSIITADRDEHIRVSRYPKSYVIERYCWGSEGFVSAIHLPPSQPNLLLSAGGEPTMQVFDWTTGALQRRVEIFPAVLPHRRVRPAPRRLKGKRKAAPKEVEISNDPTSESFYLAPDNHMLPSGQGVCIEKIDCLVVGGKTVVVFFSEGCTAVHGFVLDDEEPQIHSATFPLPVLGFTRVPGSETQLLVALDNTWGVTKDDKESDTARRSFAVVEVAQDGQITDVAQSALADALAEAASAVTASPSTLAAQPLYPNLSLFPRWPGFEEDEELAGPAGETVSAAGSAVELEGLAPKQLGRLKAQGVEVSHLISRKKRKRTGKGSSKAVEDVVE